MIVSAELGFSEIEKVMDGPTVTSPLGFSVRECSQGLMIWLSPGPTGVLERGASASIVFWKNSWGHQTGGAGQRAVSEGYTLEMPRGVSLVRLCSRNLEMLKSVSGR